MFRKYVYVVCIIILSKQMFAQGLHFSQFYNAPTLLNPANTGLLESNNWRVGSNYRNQWVAIPVPYNTFSIYADGDIGREKLETSWLGAGISVWRDVAGNGNLALTKIQTNLAYHILFSESNSMSFGLGAAYCQRSVDPSKLTFDSQWDEFSFNENLSNRENFATQKTTFIDANAGVNFTYYDNENLYMKLGVSVMHLNRPTETFLSESNKLGIRPQANLEIIYKASDNIIIQPALYYTQQKKASEFIGGSMFAINFGKMAFNPNEFLIGAYYRVGDALIGVAGYKWSDYKVTISYDHTLSDLAKANGGMGALEISLILQGNYKKGDAISNALACPRF